MQPIFTIYASHVLIFLLPIASLQVCNVLRDLVINIVLGTDMKQHVSTMNQFRSRVESVTPGASEVVEVTHSSRPTGNEPVARGRSSLTWKKNSRKQWGGPSNLSNRQQTGDIALTSATDSDMMNLPPPPSGSVDDSGDRPDIMSTAGSWAASMIITSLVSQRSGSLTSAGGGGGARLTRLPSNVNSVADGWHNKQLPHLSALHLIDDDFRVLTWKMAMKCADLGHLASAEHVHVKWVHLLEEELFRQGDLEKARGYPVSPLMDRSSGGITLSQPGFFNFIALPLFNTFASVLPGLEPMLQQVKSNYQYWMAKE